MWNKGKYVKQNNTKIIPYWSFVKNKVTIAIY